jgi:hypothetical protein
MTNRLLGTLAGLTCLVLTACGLAFAARALCEAASSAYHGADLPAYLSTQVWNLSLTTTCLLGAAACDCLGRRLVLNVKTPASAEDAARPLTRTA